jgi:sec-independent protein translocase protein TatA
MFRNPTTDLIIALVIVLLIFGPKRLPQLGKQLGSGFREFKDGITGGSKDEDDDEHEDEPPRGQIAQSSAPAVPPVVVQQPQPVVQQPEPVVQPPQPVMQPPPPAQPVDAQPADAQPVAHQPAPAQPITHQPAPAQPPAAAQPRQPAVVPADAESVQAGASERRA